MKEIDNSMNEIDNRLVTIAGLCAHACDYGETVGKVWHLISMDKNAIKCIMKFQALVNLEWLTSVIAPATGITAYHAPTVELLLADIQILSDNVVAKSNGSFCWNVCKGPATPLTLWPNTLTCHVSKSTVHWEFRSKDRLATCRTSELNIKELKKYLPPTQGMN